MAKTQKNNQLLIIITFVALVLAVGAFVFVIYGARKNTEVNLTQAEQTLQLRASQDFKVSMVSNPSTGYTWQLKDNYNQEVVEYLGNKYQASNSTAVGAGGEQVFAFKTQSKGSTTLSFYYSRPWETDKLPVQTKQLNLNIK